MGCGGGVIYIVVGKNCDFVVSFDCVLDLLCGKVYIFEIVGIGEIVF